ncbi:hypothetical protein [Kitasatospora sp. NPDC059673]|uniref:hypothetical protein n=1 Tax=Kitasatospora sp. NPDC059673 TaxID=3346901 RepID=UPI003697F50D
MTPRPTFAAAALAALALASAALLTACGPTSAPADGPDSSQVQQMQQKVDAADSAAAQADEDAGQDN